MSKLLAHNTAILQTTQHILQELEVNGIKSLPEARTYIAKEIEKRLIGRKRFRKNIEPEKHQYVYCSKCNSKIEMTKIFIDDDDGRILIMQCKKCRYSYVVE